MFCPDGLAGALLNPPGRTLAITPCLIGEVGADLARVGVEAGCSNHSSPKSHSFTFDEIASNVVGLNGCKGLAGAL